jgi:hypothetical protein
MEGTPSEVAITWTNKRHLRVRLPNVDPRDRLGAHVLEHVLREAGVDAHGKPLPNPPSADDKNKAMAWFYLDAYELGAGACSVPHGDPDLLRFVPDWAIREWENRMLFGPNYAFPGALYANLKSYFREQGHISFSPADWGIDVQSLSGQAPNERRITFDMRPDGGVLGDAAHDSLLKHAWPTMMVAFHAVQDHGVALSDQNLAASLQRIEQVVQDKGLALGSDRMRSIQELLCNSFAGDLSVSQEPLETGRRCVAAFGTEWGSQHDEVLLDLVGSLSVAPRVAEFLLNVHEAERAGTVTLSDDLCTLLRAGLIHAQMVDLPGRKEKELAVGDARAWGMLPEHLGLARVTCALGYPPTQEQYQRITRQFRVLLADSMVNDQPEPYTYLSLLSPGEQDPAPLFVAKCDALYKAEGADALETRIQTLALEAAQEKGLKVAFEKNMIVFHSPHLSAPTVAELAAKKAAEMGIALGD